MQGISQHSDAKLCLFKADDSKETSHSLKVLNFTLKYNLELY